MIIKMRLEVSMKYPQFSRISPISYLRFPEPQLELFAGDDTAGYRVTGP